MNREEILFRFKKFYRNVKGRHREYLPYHSFKTKQTEKGKRLWIYFKTDYERLSKVLSDDDMTQYYFTIMGTTKKDNIIHEMYPRKYFIEQSGMQGLVDLGLFSEEEHLPVIFASRLSITYNYPSLPQFFFVCKWRLI